MIVPIPIKSKPVPNLMYLISTNFSRTSQTRIVEKVITTSASDAATKTTHRDWLLAASAHVANWVLSPNSARETNRKIEPNVVRIDFQSIYTA
jgi:hypothetical protein